MNVHTPNMDLLSRMLTATSMRHDVIAQNIANVNTPGYQTLEVGFEDALKQAMTSGSNGDQVQPQAMVGTGGVTREDGNNVDIDLEIARLQKNTLFFKVYTQLLAGEIAQYRSAITGR